MYLPKDPRDYQLSLSSADPPAAQSQPEAKGNTPYIGVQFRCCNTYQRVYRNADGTAYLGRCPRCGKPVRFLIGPNGSSARTFVVE